MNAVYVYLMASSWFFLLGWVVLLLVAYALAFQGDSAYGLAWTRATSPVSMEHQRQRARQFGFAQTKFNTSQVNSGGQECPPHTQILG
jgi:hypothetical protein